MTVTAIAASAFSTAIMSQSSSTLEPGCTTLFAYLRLSVGGSQPDKYARKAAAQCQHEASQRSCMRVQASLAERAGREWANLLDCAQIDPSKTSKLPPPAATTPEKSSACITLLAEQRIQFEKGGSPSPAREARDAATDCSNEERRTCIQTKSMIAKRGGRAWGDLLECRSD